MQPVQWDYLQLEKSLEARPTFTSTFDYWVSPWRFDLKEAPYWRPLTMQAMWLEKQAFGMRNPNGWLWVTTLCNAVYLGLIAATAFTLTRSRWMSVITLALFVATPGVLEWLRILQFNPSSSNGLLLEGGWLDQPDIWANCCILGAILLAYHRKLWPALLVATAATTFKESGFVAFLFAFGVIAFTGQVKRTPWHFYLAVGTVLFALFALRWQAGPEVRAGGATMMSKYIWVRFQGGVAGVILQEAQWFWGAGLAALSAFVLLRWKRPTSVVGRFCLFVFAVGIGAVIQAIQSRTVPSAGLVIMLTPGLRPGFLFFGWLWIMTIVCKRYPLPLLGAILGLIVISAMPYAMSRTAGWHSISLTRSFQAIFVAMSVVALAQFISESARTRCGRTAIVA